MNIQKQTEKAAVTIQPKSGWSGLHLNELWEYRDLWFFLMWRDIQVKYRQSVLGIGWAILQPVMTMTIFSFIFGHLAKVGSEGYPYPLFVYSGLLPWIFFSTAFSASANSVVGSANLVTKVYFPRLIIPLASIGSAFLDFVISLAVMLALMIFYGQAWGASLLLIPFLCLGVAMTALGFGIALSAFMVTYRDFRHVLPFAMQIGMYLTPVVYPSKMIPEKWQWVLYLNPVAGWVSGFRSAFFGRPVDMMAIGCAFVISFLILMVSISYFHQAESDFADVI